MSDKTRGSVWGLLSILSAALATALPLLGWVALGWGFVEGAGSGGNVQEELFVGMAGSLILGGLAVLAALCGTAFGFVGLYRASRDSKLSATSSVVGIVLNALGAPATWFIEWVILFVVFDSA